MSIIVHKFGVQTPIKVKHRMHWKNSGYFYIAAFYDVWDIKEIGFGLMTTVSNSLMSVVLNYKLRMAFCLNARMANKLLSFEPVEEFTFLTFEPKLVAINLKPSKIPQTLF